MNQTTPTLDLSNKHDARGHACTASGLTLAEIRTFYILKGHTPEQINSIPYRTLCEAMTDEQIAFAQFNDSERATWLRGEHAAQKKGA